MKVKVFAIRPESEYLNFDQQQLNGFLDTIEFKKSSTHFIEAEPIYWSVLIYYEEKIRQNNLVQEVAILEKTSSKTEKISAQLQEADLDLEQLEILKSLKLWRSEKAYKLKISNFLICHNSELINVVVQKPSSITELRSIKGFGSLKSDKYGEDILSILKAS